MLEEGEEAGTIDSPVNRPKRHHGRLGGDKHHCLTHDEGERNHRLCQTNGHTLDCRIRIVGELESL